jgi:hypothetical protein
MQLFFSMQRINGAVLSEELPKSLSRASANAHSYSLQHRCHCLAVAYAEGNHTISFLPALQVADKRCNQPAVTGTYGIGDRTGSAIDVDPFGINAQHFNGQQHSCGKGFRNGGVKVILNMLGGRKEKIIPLCPYYFFCVPHYWCGSL